MESSKGRSMAWGVRKTMPKHLLGSEMVRVLVGRDAEQREFSVHKKLLCTTSAYFRDSIEQAASGSPSPLSSPSTNRPRSNSTGARPSPRAHVHAHGRSASDNIKQSHHVNGVAGEPPADHEHQHLILFPRESPDMFDLFVLWLYQQRVFRAFIDDAVRSISPHLGSGGGGLTAAGCFPSFRNMRNDTCRRALHCSLVSLHLFAALVGLPALQDVCMDAIQDLYLHCDWDMTPLFVAALYSDCDPVRARRLRKWAVAMIAWTLCGELGCATVGDGSGYNSVSPGAAPAMPPSSSAPLRKTPGIYVSSPLSASSASPSSVNSNYPPLNPIASATVSPTSALSSTSSSSSSPASQSTPTSVSAQFERLFAALPDLRDDYASHLATMTDSHSDVRVKNPQLRLPQNRLRSVERLLGFRQCSFHSHRAAVGEGPCPLVQSRSAAAGRSSSWMAMTMDGEAEQQSHFRSGEVPTILSPVSESREERYSGYI